MSPDSIKEENPDQIPPENTLNTTSEPAFDLGMNNNNTINTDTPSSSYAGYFNSDNNNNNDATLTVTPFNSNNETVENNKSNTSSVAPSNSNLPNISSPASNIVKEEEEDDDDEENIDNPTNNNGLALPKKPKQDPKNLNVSKNGIQPNSNTQASASKMQDVLFSAGVNIREEEALLNSSVTASKSMINVPNGKVPEHSPFLHPYQLTNFLKKNLEEQNFQQDFSKNTDILNFISAATETYMRDILTNSLVVSRHRRKAVKLNSGRRSNVSIALRNIALSQKKEEERRVKKRIALSLEKEDYENKADSEETLHRASNLTAGLRAGSKKQYGWLTSSTNKPTNVGSKLGKVASQIATRGDTGLRFREAREEPGIVMRDLLFALENRRMGVHNIISKGYAKIRD